MDREAKEVIEELIHRIEAFDENVIDELVAENLVNHAAGPQGRGGLKQILATISNDLGEETTNDHHHLIAQGEFVVDHMTMHGRHKASTMPLLAGTEATGDPVEWTFIHIWRVVDGMAVEHWACRDDVGLLRQIGAWPPRSPQLP